LQLAEHGGGSQQASGRRRARATIGFALGCRYSRRLDCCEHGAPASAREPAHLLDELHVHLAVGEEVPGQARRPTSNSGAMDSRSSTRARRRAAARRPRTFD
jgi:hypothetical protein